MVFEILQARSCDDSPDPMYPLPSDRPNAVVLEQDDGAARQATATAVSVEVRKVGSSVTVAKAENIKGTVTVTDSRVIFACTDFRRGGGWRGYGTAGILTAVAANAISHANAKRSTRGFSLVGHVRYEWLDAGGVTAQGYKWAKSPNAFKITFVDPMDPTNVEVLTFFLENREPALDLGEDLTRRAAFFLADRADGQRRDTLRQFATTLPSEPTGGGNGISWRLPSRP
jgi:hypothetical protein